MTAITQHAGKTTVAFLLLASLSSLAWAEGAVRTVECQITQACNAEGVCKKSSGSVKFRMAPQKVNEDGSGKYEISYAQEKADMEAISFAGPFYWATASERNTLLASSDTEFLWQTVHIADLSKTTVNFLKCELH